jgi:hypothetical protein
MYLPFLNGVQTVSEWSPVSCQLLLPLPPVELLIQDPELELLHLLDHVQVVVGQVGSLQFQVVELKKNQLISTKCEFYNN